MEFWGVEVKSGQPLEVNLGEGKVLHLSQACLGEIKSNKPSEPVYLHINIEEKKLVLGTLHSERLPQQLFDLVFDKDFQLSHNWKNGSVYFYGYKADQPTDEQDDSEDIDSDEEEEALQLPIPNGKQEVKQEAKKEDAPVVASKKDGKQKVKIVEPGKDKKADSDDSGSDDSDDSMSDDSDDSDEDNEDSSDSDDDSDEDEETPKKQQSGKKRPNESDIKTPSTDKKAKMSTPQKTDGKKPHVATPHPSKAVAKTPANKSNQKSPASAADGAHSCKSCNRNFKTDGALQSHNQAKHASK